MNPLPSAKGDTVFLFSYEGESLVETAVKRCCTDAVTHDRLDTLTHMGIGGLSPLASGYSVTTNFAGRSIPMNISVEIAMTRFRGEAIMVIST